MKFSDFDYRLSEELIAQYPCEKRDTSRLLVLDRAGGNITHRKFSDITEYFSEGDCLVLNNTRVIRARMIGRREKLSRSQGGGRQEIFLLESLPGDRFRVLARPAGKLVAGTKILFGDGKTFATVLEEEGSSRVIKFSPNGTRRDFWGEMGQVPLPPYIKREPETFDKQRYQTVYAAEEGATAAPTAGLHFTEELLDVIRDKGVTVVPVTLHVNYGTFAPVKCGDIKKHKMHREYFVLPGKTRDAVLSARTKGRKVFAVGTTSVRVLESSAAEKGKGALLLKEGEGWTDLFIYPPYKFKAVDCLLTNFHFPKSTLLMLVSAFAGRKELFKAYQEAIEKKYRFFSYGDAMLIV